MKSASQLKPVEECLRLQMDNKSSPECSESVAASPGVTA